MSGEEGPHWMVPLKFGKRQHLEEFRAGLLYMNSEIYFSNLENDPLRGDRFEGTDYIHQPVDVKRIRIEDHNQGKIFEIGPKDLTGPVLISLSQPLIRNIFCMFAVMKPVNSSLVDDRNFGFGDSFVVVLDTQEFLNRVKAGAALARFRLEHGLVKYYDVTKHSGETGLFTKPSTFAFQQEFRIVIEPGSAKAVRLSIGDITDITTPIHSLSAINNLIDFSTEMRGVL